MPVPESAFELGALLERAIHHADLALSGEHQELPDAIHSAQIALSQAIDAIERSRFAPFQISPSDEDRLTSLVVRIRSLYRQLAVKMVQAARDNGLVSLVCPYCEKRFDNPFSGSNSYTKHVEAHEREHWN
jgi:hypothetical protein